jgi:membrane protein implicated in regulation of membrane protease activity
MTVGYYLFANRKLKAAIQTWIGIVFVTFLPYIVIFPVVYQILSVCILAIAFVSFLYWYRSRYLKSRSEAHKQDKNTSS